MCNAMLLQSEKPCLLRARGGAGQSAAGVSPLLQDRRGARRGGECAHLGQPLDVEQAAAGQTAGQASSGGEERDTR